ncbi:MAG TPA: ATP-binding cassette domain-containing protein [Actinomycetota bacterium]
MTKLIEVESLTKVYPDGTRAVDDVSFHVEEGEMFGFLGPNGAGKTTTIRILVTLLPKTAGSARVGGIEVSEDPDTVRRSIGYAAQFIGVDDDLTAHENLVLQARLHGIGKAEARRRAEELLEVFALSPVAGRRAATLSGGMRRRLDLAQALAHRPPLVFLDEPTTGLDPQTRNAMWRYLEELNRGGTTVFLTTQYLEEADRLCTRLAIIDHGRIVVEGSPAELKKQVGGDVVTLSLEDHEPETVRRALEAVTAFPGAGEPRVFDHSISLPVKDAGEALSALVRRLDAAGIPVSRLSMSSPTLDEVFLRHTGERMRVEDPNTRASSPAFRVMRGRR